MKPKRGRKVDVIVTESLFCFMEENVHSSGSDAMSRRRSRDRPSADTLLFPFVSTCEGNGANESRLAVDVIGARKQDEPE